jgi:hypothetical protein
MRSTVRKMLGRIARVKQGIEKLHHSDLVVLTGEGEKSK